MRLAEFILANVEPILAEWEAFARTIWPVVLKDPAADPTTLRDHAEEILRTAANDMASGQSAQQQSDKSKGIGENDVAGAQLDRASERHGKERGVSGFELSGLVAEYRALRASVLRLWEESKPTPDLRDLKDITRFNESVDQSLAESVRSYAEQVDRDRELLLRNEQEARETAENANRAKDMFLATLSHEMRTPLNAIVGWINILRMSGPDEAILAEAVDVIERNTAAQVKLIEDVLDVSRIVSGKVRLEICDCDLIKTINAAINSVRPAAEAKNIKLNVQLDPTAGRGSCDAARVQQIVWNLLSNAIKFTSKGGTVGITLDRDHSASRITVDDDGEGISKELLPFVFDRFRQADNSNRRQYGGLGLGLSIVKHIAEMHGGTVEATSGGVGHGAAFTVRLPINAVVVDEGDSESGSLEIKDDGRGSATRTGQPGVRLDGLRLLVVDDEADARRVLAKLLGDFGARVTTAANAADALAALSEATAKAAGPHVLVSDVGMPNQNGYDLIREVRRLGYSADDLPAMALTAFARPDDAREAASAGFQEHMSKPVNFAELTAVVASLARPAGSMDTR